MPMYSSTAARMRNRAITAHQPPFFESDSGSGSSSTTATSTATMMMTTTTTRTNTGLAALYHQLNHLQLSPHTHHRHHQQQSYRHVQTSGLPANPLHFPTPIIHRSQVRSKQVVRNQQQHQKYQNVTILCRTTSTNSTKRTTVSTTPISEQYAYWIKEQISLPNANSKSSSRGSAHYVGVIVVPRVVVGAVDTELKDSNHCITSTTTATTADPTRNNHHHHRSSSYHDWITTDEMVVIQVSFIIPSLTKQPRRQNHHATGLLNEAACLQLLGNYHANILSCIEVLQDDRNNRLYTILPYYDGNKSMTLESYLRKSQQSSQWNTTTCTGNFRQRIDPTVPSVAPQTSGWMKKTDCVPASDGTVRTVSSDGTSCINDDNTSIATSCMFTVYENSDNDTITTNISNRASTTEKTHTRKTFSDHENNVRGLFVQLLDALQHLQRKGVCHRNINPFNVLIIVESDAFDCFSCNTTTLALMDFTCAVRIPYKDDSNTGGIADVSQGTNHLLILNDACHHPNTSNKQDERHAIRTNNSNRSPRACRYHSTLSLSPSNRYQSTNQSFVPASKSRHAIPSNVRQVPILSPFIAPELVEGQPYDGYTVDLWSAGVLLYVMLMDTVPFNVPNAKMDMLYRQINNGQLKQSIHQQRIANNGNHSTIRCTNKMTSSNSGAQSLQFLSEEVMDLLQNMFWYDPRQRLTLQDVMAHPWTHNIHP